uniref:Motile sperm domain-containing protein 2 n=1 Tax=Cacopsylla melanoneura TaxID=428564 RepID=A0A8D9A013_9HEMI
MISQDLVSELRRAFYEKLNSEGLTEDHFHKNDIHKISANPNWLTRFLIHHDENVQDALGMLWETLVWRKENNVNDINENTVNMNFIKDGSMFIHSQDIDGKVLLIFKCKTHIKGQKDWEENKRCIIYWFERAERLNKGDKITIFFDMAETGLANMDMEYTKYLIGLCKQYYPNFLNYILIFEMPWVMNATFKLIKSWLPAKAVEKIKFVNKSSLKDFVLAKHALTSWGGEDNYVFVYEPEEAIMSTLIENNGASSVQDDNRKRVHFMDGSPGDVRSNASSSLCSEDIAENQFIVTSVTQLSISPSDCVLFKKEKGGEIVGQICIANKNSKSIAFKIKTTSPEKFRVRPGSGVLSPDEKLSVCVSVQEGVPARDILGDKFLVMSTILNNETEPVSSTDLVVLWKSISSSLVDQHRLKCSLHVSLQFDSIVSLSSSGGGEKQSNGAAWRENELDMLVSGGGAKSFAKQDQATKLDSLYHAVQSLSEGNKQLRKQSKNNQYLLIFTLSLLVLLTGIVFYMLLNENSASHYSSSSPQFISSSASESFPATGNKPSMPLKDEV